MPERTCGRPHGKEAQIIGGVAAGHPRPAVTRPGISGLTVGEQLPRIC